uniref:Poly [ADP-ribose] polymerase n=1 Tax=Leptobrachium leishanense TaxID=445787 RepID=A0A8C5MTE4_9ANUR
MHEPYELSIKETLVTLKNGDITKEDVQAVVNPNNSSLTQTFGISKVILEAGGAPLQEECKQQGKQLLGDIVVTGAGNLKWKYIIHVIEATQPASITKAVKKVLEVCDTKMLNSVAFPDIGTGAASLDPKESIKAILKGIREYLTEHHLSVPNISIVTFTPDVYQAYLEVMKTEKVQNPNLNFKVHDTTVELVNGDITEQAVDCILNLTNSTLNQNVGVSGAILSAAGPVVADECKRIGTINTEVAVTSGGNLKSKHIMHVIGPTIISGMAPSLDKILMECKARSFTTIALPAIGTGIARINPADSIEAILAGIDQCLAKMNDAVFTKILIIAYDKQVCIDYLKVFQARQQKDMQNSTINMKLLKERLQDPPNWSFMEDKEVYKDKPVHKDSAEFKSVEKKFLKSANNSRIEITGIKRIQNKELWRKYAFSKFFIDLRYPNQKNQKHLFHGTDYNTTRDINLYGFNRSYNGKNATVYGQGTYFARDASYSCIDTYSKIDDNGEKHVYQVAVITGKWCLGNWRCVEPPKTEDPNIRYDTTVDDVDNPTIFVVYHDYVAYPKYLISFKISK